MRQTPLFKILAMKTQAYKNAQRDGNTRLMEIHTETLERLARNFLPSGAGVDSGTQIDLERSNGNKLVLNTSFHHMDEHGGYDGWTDHSIIVTCSLVNDFQLHVTGKNRNQIKDVLYDRFDDVLRIELPEQDWRQ